MSDADSRLEKVKSFLAERGVSGKCPCCGHEDWTLVENSGLVTGIPLIPTSGAMAYSQTYIQTDTLICKHCGFVRHHARPVVDGVP